MAGKAGGKMEGLIFYKNLWQEGILRQGRIGNDKGDVLILALLKNDFPFLKMDIHGLYIGKMEVLLSFGGRKNL